ncbi:MAG: type II toxin-antitoxin system VapC family toxin [Thermoplasmata archaeon]
MWKRLRFLRTKSKEKEGFSHRKACKGGEKKHDSIYTTVISQYELLTPVYHKGLKNEERTIRAFLRRSVVLPLDQKSAEESSRIMGGLFKLGIPVNALDTLIAGIAIVAGANKIATLDRDFLQIVKVTDIDIVVI